MVLVTVKEAGGGGGGERPAEIGPGHVGSGPSREVKEVPPFQPVYRPSSCACCCTCVCTSLLAAILASILLPRAKASRTARQ